jgi:hypothetical protein
MSALDRTHAALGMQRILVARRFANQQAAVIGNADHRGKNTNARSHRNDLDAPVADDGHFGVGRTEIDTDNDFCHVLVAFLLTMTSATRNSSPSWRNPRCTSRRTVPSATPEPRRRLRRRPRACVADRGSRRAPAAAARDGWRAGRRGAAGSAAAPLPGWRQNAPGPGTDAPGTTTAVALPRRRRFAGGRAGRAGRAGTAARSALDRCRLLARPLEIALQSLAVLTQVVAEKPQLIERILELARLQPQFVLQHRHLAEQGGQVDRCRCVGGALSSQPEPAGSPGLRGARDRREIVDQTLSFLRVEDDHTGEFISPPIPQQPPLGRWLRGKIAADGAQQIVDGRRRMVEQLVRQPPAMVGDRFIGRAHALEALAVTFRGRFANRRQISGTNRFVSPPSGRRQARGRGQSSNSPFCRSS